MVISTDVSKPYILPHICSAIPFYTTLQDSYQTSWLLCQLRGNPEEFGLAEYHVFD